MRPKHYVLFVVNDIEPELHGPFTSVKEQDRHARELKREHGNDHGIFPLDINRKGEPGVTAYTAGFFMEGET